MKKLVRMICLLLVFMFIFSTFAACDINIKENKDDDKDNGSGTAQQCANGHTPGDWVEIPATCTTPGTRQKSCTVCRAVLQTETTSVALGHVEGEWTSAVATCTLGAGRVKSCTRCQSVIKREADGTPALGHNVSAEWQVVTEATLQSEGEKIRCCLRCGVTVETEVIPKIPQECAEGHDAGEWEAVAATCTVAGGMVKRCIRCQTVVEEEKVGEPLGHNKGLWQTVVEATTETVGRRARLCTRCGIETEVAEIPKLGQPSNPGSGLLDRPSKDHNGHEWDDLDQYGLNYGGEEIVLLYWKEVERPEFEQKELANDNVLDAIYDRNINVEDRLGVDLVFVPMYAAYGSGVREEFLRKIDSVYLAKSHDYDIIATYARTEGSLAIRGHLQDFSKIEQSYMNLEKPWWPKNLVETVSFGNGSYYFVSGDMSTNAIWMMQCMFINEDLFSKLKIALPYQDVRTGNWTIDELIEITKDQWVDIDNDNKLSVRDQVGFCAMNYVFDSLYTSAGMKYFEKDDTTLLKISPDYTSAKAEALINKLGEWARSNAVWMTSTGLSDAEMSSYTRNLFQRGRTLIWYEHFCFADSSLSLGKVDFNYGIVPSPKYDTAQEQYYTAMGNPVSLYGIFVDLYTRGNIQETLSMMTAVLECYASENYRLVNPEIYETSMGLKYVQGQDMVDMYECIHSSIVFDLGKIFSADTNNLPERPSNAMLKGEAWEDAYPQFLPGAQVMLNQIVDYLKQLQTPEN